MAALSPRPGLAKAAAVSLVRGKVVALIATIDGRVRDLLEGADVMSEGSVVHEGSSATYFGSTSVLLTPATAGVSLRDLSVVARCDPHLRTRVLRIARRETLARAVGMGDTARVELSVREHAGAVVMTVDVTMALCAALDSGASS